MQAKKQDVVSVADTRNTEMQSDFNPTVNEATGNLDKLSDVPEELKHETGSLNDQNSSLAKKGASIAD